MRVMATHCLNTKPKQTFTSNQSHSTIRHIWRIDRFIQDISPYIANYLYGDESLFFEHEPMDMLGSSTFALHESGKG